MPNYNMLMSVTENCRLVGQYAREIRKLVVETHFNRMELEALLIIFTKLTESSPMNIHQFQIFLHKAFGMTDILITERLFRVLDRTRKKELDFEVWVCGLSILLRGKQIEQMKLCFQVYDLMDQGAITKDEMFRFLKYTFRKSTDEEAYDVAKELGEALMKKMDTDRNNRVDFEEYCECVRSNKNMLEFLGPVLPSRTIIHAFFTTFTRLPGRV